MAFLSAFIGSAVKFVVFLGLIAGGFICGAKYKDSKSAK